jgi:hypothetical protein
MLSKVTELRCNQAVKELKYATWCSSWVYDSVWNSEVLWFTFLRYVRVFYYQKGNQLMDLQHYSMIVQEIIIYVMKFVYFFMQVVEWNYMLLMIMWDIC